MIPFAETPPTVRFDLLLLVEFAFLLYVFFSFMSVAAYTTKQVRANRLVDGKRAPIPFAIPPAGFGLFLINLSVMVLMGFLFYAVVVFSGLFLVWCVGRNKPREWCRSMMQQSGGWFFIANTLTLLYLQSPLFMVLIVAGICFLLLESGRTAQEQFGLARMRRSTLVKWSLLICGAVVLVEVPLTAGVEAAMDLLHLPHPEQETVVMFRHIEKRSELADFMIQAVFLAPLLEELFFRGFLLTFLKKYSSTWLAIILSAGIFAFAHLSLGSVLQLWVLGIVLGVAYEHTGSLFLPMGIHACFNLLTALNLLVEKVTS